MKFRQRPNVFGVSGKVGVTLQRVLWYLSKKFESLFPVSQSGKNVRVNCVVYSKCPYSGTTRAILNLCFQQWGNTGALYGQICVHKG